MSADHVAKLSYVPGNMKDALLTPTQLAVVQATVLGCDLRKVAGILGVARKTADTHLADAMRRLGTHSRSELVLEAVRREWVVMRGRAWYPQSS